MLDLWGNDNSHEYKTCTKCNNVKHLSEYGTSSGANYLRNECRKCNGKLAKTRKYLLSVHGKPGKDYVCPICNSGWDTVLHVGGVSQTNPWVIDHDHKTENFRGWLCHNCNRGLGTFNDDVELLRRAIKYIVGEGDGSI